MLITGEYAISLQTTEAVRWFTEVSGEEGRSIGVPSLDPAEDALILRAQLLSELLDVRLNH